MENYIHTFWKQLLECYQTMVESCDVWTRNTKVITHPELYNISWNLLNLPNCKVMRAQQQSIIKRKYTSKLEHQQNQRAQQAAWARSSELHVIHESFTSILPTAHIFSCIRGERERKSCMIDHLVGPESKKGLKKQKDGVMSKGHMSQPERVPIGQAGKIC